MIKLTNLNKFYNPKKRNEIHVINNISLEFPETGLVCLLGPSGSGKTTLLNVIGGLDSVDSGTININGNEMARYNELVWNSYRNRQFGYIFQNYLLLPDLTVCQNLELVLKIFNLRKEEADERIDYALKAVGMERYKNRKPTELSGGQQQRVSIARALIKSPDVFIADEPTGNIDEHNTTQIMNILKKISQNSLIILVTHERRLADFYGDRIIELKDGCIVADYTNSSKNSLDSLDDNNIYLQEFDKDSNIIKDVDVSYFYKDKVDDKNLKLNIIYRNNTFYIHSLRDDVNIKFLENKSEIKVFDSKKPILDLEKVQDTTYYLPKLDINNTKKQLSLKPKHIFKLAFDNIKNLKVIQKILILMFFMSSIVLTFGFASYNSSNYVNEKVFLDYDRDLVEVTIPNVVTTEDLDALASKFGVEYFLAHHYYTKINRFRINEFYQRSSNLFLEKSSIFPIDSEKSKVLYGRLPESTYEIVIDISLLDEMIQSNNAKSLGIKTYEQFLGLVSVERFGEYKIVGIVNNDAPVFYATEEGYKLFVLSRTMVLSNIEYMSYYYLYDDVNITEYHLINPNIEKTENIEDLKLEKNQILVSNRLYIRNGKNNNFILNGYQYEIVGVYDYRSTTDESIYLLKNQLDDMYNISLLNGGPIYFVSDNKIGDLETLSNMEIAHKDVYDIDYKTNVILEKDTTALFYSTIVTMFTLVFLYFIMRSSVISRSYSIGVLRALGVGRINVILIFVFEVLLITLLSSFIGIVLFSIALTQVNSVYMVLYYPWYVPLTTLTIILIFNVLIGILPVIPYLRKTPSQILSKFDM